MNILLALIWFIMLITFVVFWRKKVNIKKKYGGDSTEYAKVSKTKRIIGIICIAAFVGCYVTTPIKQPEPMPAQDIKPEVVHEQVKLEDVSRNEPFQKTAEDAVYNALDAEEIVSVTHQGTTLIVKLDETKIIDDGVDIPLKDTQAGRVISIGDKIANIPGLEEAVQNIVVEFRDGKKIEMPTSIIKTNAYNMRYFPSNYIYDNLK